MESNRPELLGVLDAAMAKGVHQETVRRAIRAGRLPARRIGRNFVIRPTDLRAWRPHHEKAPGRRAARHTSRVEPRVSYRLPAAPTPLLGRELELAAVHAHLISEGRRLVTLTGPGGCGKTRLALEAAGQIAGAFEHGVWFVDLAPLHDAALILPTIAQMLDVRNPQRRPLQDVLVGRLHDRRLLLVLDNCEHLLAGIPEVANLLGACPEMWMLATSREALHLMGEQVLPVQPLRLPDLADESTAEAVGRSPAAALFVQRASAADPAFHLTDGNARAVAEICVRLDGLPLAIELAAARVRIFSAEQIAARLDDRFRLLTTGPRTAPPRQQSLRATVDWSYGLLAQPERALLRRLSVFAGGWTFEAAEVVAAGEGVRSDAVLDLLAQLVDKSLVIAEPQHGAMRYRLHESIRQYAREQLQGVGEADTTRDRHLAYFLALAEEAEPKLRGAESQLFLDRLEEEHANLRVALEWALQPSRRDDAALRLSGALAWFWWVRSHLEDGRRWLARALDETSGSPTARMKALYGEAHIAHHQRDAPTARRRLEESLALARELGDRWAESWVLHLLGRVAYYDDDTVTARSLGEESLALAEDVGDGWLIAWALHLLGLAAHIAADYPTSRDYYTRSLAIRRELGFQEGISTLTHLLGLVAVREGDLGRARTLFREGLAAARGVHGPWGMAMPLAAFAYLAAAFGQPLRAVRLGATAGAICEAYQSPLIPLFEPLLNQALDVAREALDDDAYAAAWAEGRAMALDESIAEAFAVEAGPPSRPLGKTVHLRKAARFGELTPAELQVLRLLSGGPTTREIAAELVVSISTVDRHLTHIYTKLGVRNRAEATAFALKQGLI
jgi:non-specific serine/threonine protein kinase